MSHNTAYSGKRDPINCPANQPKPTTGEWTVWRDGMGEWGIYRGNETKKGWSGKGKMFVSGLTESQAIKILNAHKAALAAERDKVERLGKLLRSMPRSFGITENDLK